MKASRKSAAKLYVVSAVAITAVVFILIWLVTWSPFRSSIRLQLLASVLGRQGSGEEGSREAKAKRQPTYGAWTHACTETEGIFPQSISLDSAGNVLISGGSQMEFTVQGSAYFAKFSSKGKLLWEHALGGKGEYHPCGFKSDQSGNLYLAGTKGDLKSGECDIFLLKLTAKGRLLWGKLWGTPKKDTALGMCVGNDDNVYVVGAANEDSMGHKSAAFLRFSPDGSLLWQKSWRLSTADTANDIASDSRGNLLLALSSGGWDEYSPDKGVIAKYSPDGKLLWQEAVEYALISHLTTDGDDNIYFGGSTGFAPDRSERYGASYLTKLSPDGNFLWRRLWADNEWDGVMGIALPDDNTVYAYGFLESDYGFCTVYLLKYTAEGKLLIQAGLNPEHSEDPSTTMYSGKGSGIAADKTGNVYVCWSSEKSNATWRQVKAHISEQSRPFKDVAGTETTLKGKMSDVAPHIGFPMRTINVEYKHALTMVSRVPAGRWPSATIPAAPSETIATAVSPTEVEVKWTANSNNEEGFAVERRRLSETEWTKAGTSTMWSPPFKDTGLSPESVFVYRVKAFNSAGESESSNEVSVTTFTDPNKPQPGLEWTKEIFTGEYGRFTSCVLDENEDLIATGSTLKSFLLTRFSANGNPQWMTRYEYQTTDRDYPSFDFSKVALDSSGNIIAAGSYDNLLEKRGDILIAKFTSVGELLWINTWGSSEDDNVEGIGADGKGNIYVAGTTNGFHSATTTDCGYTSAFLVKYSPSGKKLWDLVYGDDYTMTEANALAVRKDGHAFIAGWYLPCHYDGEKGPLLAEFTPEGKLAFHKYWKALDVAIFESLALASDGSLYITGDIHLKDGKSELIEVKYSPEKGVLWGKKYNSNGTCILSSAGPRGLFIILAGEQPQFLQLGGEGEVISEIQYSLSPGFNVQGYAENPKGNLYIVGNGEKPYCDSSSFAVTVADWKKETAGPSWPKVLKSPSGITETELEFVPAAFAEKPQYGDLKPNSFILKLDFEKLAAHMRPGK
jgi:uncharacterized delta-60 repeat protein